MASYPIPPDIREKEKIVGGMLTVSQTIVIGIGGALAFFFVQAIYSTTKNILLSIIGIAPVAPALFLALYKKHDYGDMEYIQYLIFLWKFKRSRKQFPNINENFQK